ncbi:MAG: hypothetical protein IH851_09415 [Armatimonadetes bacterium]|nr:hypothetical protein [Armatimonadota bacterium]
MGELYEPVEVRAAGSERMREFLRAHPYVRIDTFERGAEPHIEFRRGTWMREARQGHPSIDGPYGLPELMDNNPLVCADRASCPGPAATLALIGLGPLALGGLMTERPSALFSFDGDYDEVDAALATEGWTNGVTCAGDPLEFDGCVAATCVAAIRVPDDPSELEDLYDECLGRSFFVRRQEDGGDLSADRVKGEPFALYALALSNDEGLLKVQVVADAHGKAGDAQVLHLMNIMAGFEEDLGMAGA